MLHDINQSSGLFASIISHCWIVGNCRPQLTPPPSLAASIKNPLFSPHDCYLNLDSTQYHRCYAYRELFREALSPEDIHAIRRAAYYSIPLGSDHFVEQIEKKIGRKVGHSQRGRPLKNWLKINPSVPFNPRRKDKMSVACGVQCPATRISETPTGIDSP